jgi:molecular chaperone IbpA
MESVGSSTGASHAQIAHEEDLEMRTNFDFTPYRRSTVGFDRLFDLLETGMRGDGPDGYPPFDIARDGEDSYRITVAVAGFRPDEIEVVAQQNQLTITGKRTEDKDKGEYLHRGIAARPFERRFQLADFIEVQSANFENGLLTIALQRVVPEAMKPRKIEIGGGSAGQEKLEAPAENVAEAA